MDFAGFVDDAGELFDEAFFGEALSFFEVDEGDVGAFEEFFHIVRVAAGVFGIVFDAIFEFDSADGAEGTLVAEDEIDGFVVDETVGGVTVLSADFVTEEGTETDVWDDVKFFAKEVVEHLEALFFGANHEMFAGAIFEAIDGVALATASGNADEDRHQKQ